MQVTYSIATRVGGERVTGEELTEHLATHKDKDDGMFVVDHIASGLRVVRVGTLAAARLVAEEIEGRIKWDELVTDPDASRDSNNTAISQEVRDYLGSVRGKHRAWKIGEGAPKPPAVRVSLLIRFEDDLRVEDLWPDYDWPDVIDEAAVRELIGKCGGAQSVVDEWNLSGSVEVEVRPSGAKESACKPEGKR